MLNVDLLFLSYNITLKNWTRFYCDKYDGLYLESEFHRLLRSYQFDEEIPYDGDFNAWSNLNANAFCFLRVCR